MPKRGEIWTLATGGDYGRKPRPALVVQNDLFHTLGSVTVCPLTSYRTSTAQARPVLEPTDRNGLRERSHVMVDKIVTVRKDHLGAKVGMLAREEIVPVEEALALFLGLAG